MVNIIIVTHGEFGAYLVEAAEDIVGKQGDGVKVVSISARLSAQEARKRVVSAVEELKKAEGLIIMTDMPGGTPSNIVLPAAKDLPNVYAVSGLNLYMLISAFNHRKTSSASEIVEKIMADGRKSIQDIKAALRSQYHVDSTSSH